MATEAVCRGCGKPTGKVSNKPEIEGAKSYGICPVCSARERRICPKKLENAGLDEEEFNDGLWNTYIKAVDQFQVAIDGLSAKKCLPKPRLRLRLENEDT